MKDFRSFLFLSAWLISSVIFILGMINPKLAIINYAKKGRKQVFFSWFIIGFTCLILFIISIDTDDNNITSFEDQTSINISESSNEEISNSTNNLVEDTTSSSVPTLKPTPEVKETYIIGEIAMIDDTSVQVTGIEKSNGSKYDKPKDGYEYIIVTVVIKNCGNNTIDYNSYDFKIANSNGQITDSAFSIIDSDTSLSSGDLLPGGVVSGTIVYEEPINDSTLTLIYEPSYWSDDKVQINLLESLDEFQALESESITVEGDIVDIGEYGDLDGVKIKIISSEISSGTKYDTPKEGMEYLIVNVEILNNGNNNISYNYFDFNILNSKGQINYAIFSSINSDTYLSSGELMINGQVEGSLIFEVPVDDQNLILIYEPNVWLDEKIYLKIESN